MKMKQIRAMLALLLSAALLLPGLPSAAYAADDPTYVWRSSGEDFTEEHFPFGSYGVLKVDPDSGKFFYLYLNNSERLDVFAAESETGPWEFLGSPSGSISVSYDLAVYEGTPYIIYRDGNNGSKATVKYFVGDEWVPLGTEGFTEGFIGSAKIHVSDDGIFAAFIDYVNDYENSIFTSSTELWRFNGTDWEVIFPHPGMNGTDLTVADGSPYLAMYTDSVILVYKVHIIGGAAAPELVGEGEAVLGGADISQASLWVDGSHVYVAYVEEDGNTATVKMSTIGESGWTELVTFQNVKGNLQLNGWQDGMALTYTSTVDDLLVAQLYNGTDWMEVSGSATARLSVAGAGDKLYAVTAATQSGKGALRVMANNSAPTVSGVSVSGTVQVGQTLTGNYTFEDADGDAEGDSVYRWYTAEDAGGTGKTVIEAVYGKTLTLTADQQGKYIIFEVTPVASEGASPGTAVSSAPVGPVAAAPSPGSSSDSSSPATETIRVEVKDGKNGNGAVVASAVIQRTTDPNGRKRDEVNLTSEQADQTVQQLKAAGSQSAVIVIPDPNDEVAELNVKLPEASTTLLANEGIDLELSTGNVRIAIPSDSMKDLEEDVYFRIVPVKREDERQEIEQRAKTEQAVLLALGSGNAEVIGRPMVIETNMQSRPVTLVLPLGDAPLSEEQLEDIGVFIEHSDGTKEFVRGEIVPYDESGKPGIRIRISKFSTFAIVYVEGWTVRHEAYISGYPDGSFKPENFITRAEMASILARTMDKEFTATASSFSDVPASHWAYDVIRKTVSMGLMQGYSDGTMKPDQAITRAEMAVIAAKWLGSGKAEASGSAVAFSDLDNHWAKETIAAVSQAGILSGYEDGTFRPDQPLTRAEAVTIMNQLLGRGPYTEAPQKWVDVPATHWAYGHIQEASIDHSAER